MNFFTCVFIAHNAIACINGLIGSESLECIWQDDVRICIDTRADVACYQDTFKENLWEGKDILENIITLNEVCGE